jgi:Zn finger protein HypA/HybF involved in hydrogenase expression
MMNLEPELNFCPDCEAKLEYESGELSCPACG